MGRIVMVGSGVVGMCGAMLAAREGHDVVVLERDAAEPPATPDGAWDEWERRGVNQFRMGHLLLARFRHELERELPEAVDALEAFGALRQNPVDGIPDEIRGERRPDDDRFEILTARRPVAEAAVASVASRHPGIEIRRGVAVAGVVVDDGGPVPVVTGVRTERGETIDADVVVDAGGRRSPLPRWLAEHGVEVAEEADDMGFVYYGKHFRSADGSVPAALGGALQPHDSVSVLTLAADNGTWGTALVASADDPMMRRAKDNDTWERVMRSFPLTAHWVDGEPLEDAPVVMAKLEDRVRSLVVDGRPRVGGVVTLGDAWACTNPSVGRGISIGMMHAVSLRDVVRESGVADPVALTLAAHDATQRDVQPYIDDTLAFDRARLAEIEAQVAGRPYVNDDPAHLLGRALVAGATHHPDLLRGYLEVVMVLARGVDVLSRPGIAELAIEHGGEPEALPGPTRAELLDLIAA